MGLQFFKLSRRLVKSHSFESGMLEQGNMENMQGGVTWKPGLWNCGMNYGNKRVIAFFLDQTANKCTAHKKSAETNWKFEHLRFHLISVIGFLISFINSETIRSIWSYEIRWRLGQEMKSKTKKII